MAALLMLANTEPKAQEACALGPEKSAVNPDGSTLSVTTTCDESGARRYLLRTHQGSSSRAQEMLVDSELTDAPTGGASLVDIDGDGYHEVEVRGMCGAGPNCMGDLYRVNRRTGKLQQFFSGGYAELMMIDGYLVESGRASCCSWEYHAYKLDDRDEVRGYENMDLMVEVGADLSSDEPDPPIRCSFSRPGGDGRTVVPPPGKPWLSLCTVYGDTYHVVTPQEAREAERAASEQE
ncbi:MAG: hypothetical protein EOO80_11530 [Oxalobacteraceae bacterium]|nr:MAG: hypothetical protein EOO80_11530 [Oxalobacteraceae bacterium]